MHTHAWIPAVLLLASQAVAAPSLQIIHSFDSAKGDPGQPYAVSAIGTTIYGGTFDNRSQPPNNGTIFSIGADGTEQVLATYATSGLYFPQGETQLGKLIYGVSEQGGDYNLGAVFTIDPASNKVAILQSFNGLNGAEPAGPLTRLDGKLWGIANLRTGSSARSTLYSVTSGGQIRSRHDFPRLMAPGGTLAVGNGVLYGSYDGMIFSATSAGVVTNLYTFPYSGYITISNLCYYKGNMFGVTTAFNNVKQELFQITPSGTETTLHTFGPHVVLAKSLVFYHGAFYGAYLQGPDYGPGAIWRIKPDGHGFTIVHQFTGKPDGYSPTILTVGADGIYGGSVGGGANNDGAIFKLVP